MFNRLRAKHAPTLRAGGINQLNLKGGCSNCSCRMTHDLPIRVLISAAQSETAAWQLGYFRDDTIRINTDYCSVDNSLHRALNEAYHLFVELNRYLPCLGAVIDSQ
jgi:hypothetical protein